MHAIQNLLREKVDTAFLKFDGKNYKIIVDYYSKYMDIVFTNSLLLLL